MLHICMIEKLVLCPGVVEQWHRETEMTSSTQESCTVNADL